MLKKKRLAAFLVAAMFFTIVPTTALAQTAEESEISSAETAENSDETATNPIENDIGGEDKVKAVEDMKYIDLVDGVNVYEVYTADGFRDVVEIINNDETGNGQYEIVLKNDIDLGPIGGADVRFTKNATTIVNSENSMEPLTLKTRNGLGCSSSAILNFEGIEKGLILTPTEGDFNPILIVEGNGTINISDCVTLIGTLERTGGPPAVSPGVQLNGSAVLNMTGGTITKCGSSYPSFPYGGVLADGSSQFNMKGGTIDECTTGVFVQNNAVFNMENGTITKCSSKFYGTGVLILSSEDNQLNGGTISYNKCITDEYGNGGIGGGVYIQGKAIISDECKIYNNSAEIRGDDIYFSGTHPDYLPDALLQLGMAPTDKKLLDTDIKIDGWYIDGREDNSQPRWTEKRTKYEFASPIKETVCLKAAYGDTYTVTYTDGVENEEIFRDYVINNCPAGGQIPIYKDANGNTRPSREGYKFVDWKSTPDNVTTVTDNILFEAMWEKVYTVTYTDGVEGEEIFTDQVNEGLLSDSSTPAFQGDAPVREGYTFKGWDKPIAEKVTEDAVYTAQWEKIADPVKPTESPNPTPSTPPRPTPSATPVQPSNSTPNTAVNSPDTGDGNNIALWAGVMLVSGIGLTAVTLCRTKKKFEQ